MVAIDVASFAGATPNSDPAPAVTLTVTLTHNPNTERLPCACPAQVWLERKEGRINEEASEIWYLHDRIIAI